MSLPDSEQSAERLLAERIGLDSETVGPGAIARAIHVRMSALGLHDRNAYLARLAGSEDEQQELVEEVVVPESWFFRGERPFAALRNHVCARRDGAEKGGPASAFALRVLSIPCGCGEEPYSIAITLRDLGLTPGSFQIDAVDVSARHLAAAERGVYRANSFRGKDLGFLERYFQPRADGQSFTLDASVRATVRFSRGNLLDPNLLRGHAPYDIIFCRNVLIYFDAASRRRALDTLDRLLGTAGLLFLGHADRIAIDDPRFVLYGDNADFTLRRTNQAKPTIRTQEPAKPLLLAEPKPKPELGAKSVPPRRAPSLTPTLRRDATASGTPSEASPVALPESSATLLAEAAALADRGRHAEAAAQCDTALGRYGPSAPVFFLRGLVRQAGGRLAEAESDFRKAIYLEPGHDEALLALALIAQRRGESETAAALRRRADRARARKGKP